MCFHVLIFYTIIKKYLAFKEQSLIHCDIQQPIIVQKYLVRASTYWRFLSEKWEYKHHVTTKSDHYS